MFQRLSPALALSTLAFVSATASATVVTSVPVGYDTKTLTFSPYDGNTSTATGLVDATTTVDVGAAESLGESVLLSADLFNSSSFILGAVSENLGSNGSWPHAGGYAGLNDTGGSLTFTFSRDLDFVGGFINFMGGDIAGANIRALDEFGNFIESAAISFNLGDPSVVGGGMYFGIRLDDPSLARIRKLELMGSFASIDDLSFGTAPSSTGVPEPGTTGLVLASVGALALTRRRTR